MTGRLAVSPEAQQAARSVTLEAVVIRADGTREDLGTVARWHRNPFVRLWWKVTGR